MKKKKQHITQSIPSPLERARVRLKVCGMKYEDNMSQVAAMQPDYLGFIFYNKSTRHFNLDLIPKIPDSIKKTGVFVDENLGSVIEKIQTYQLQAVQLHGKESPEYCRALRNADKGKVPVEIIKVFSIKDEFNFDVLKPYETAVDFFLFDTKGKLPGGNGYTFDWNVLSAYSSTKPFFLSGGIGLDQMEDIKAFKTSAASKYCYAIDVNSKFETEPGLKDIELLKRFKDKLCHFE